MDGIAGDLHMEVAGRQMDMAGAQRIAVAGFAQGRPAGLGQMLRQHRREGRRHVLGRSRIGA